MKVNQNRNRSNSKKPGSNQRFKWKKRDTTQNSIPYEHMYEDGICYLGKGRYSATYHFSDTNYANTSEQVRVGIFEQYCNFLNALDESLHVQMHIYKKPLTKTKARFFLDEKHSGSMTADQLLSIHEYNKLMKARITGAKSFIQEKYITISISESSHESASRKFDRLDSDTLSLLRKIKCETHRLNEVNRLYFLREIYRPDDETAINMNDTITSGLTGKDRIAPFSAESIDNTKYLKLGDYYTQTLFLANFPTDLSDDIVHAITDVDKDILMTINISPQNPKQAIDETRSRLKKLDMEKFNSMRRQSKNGVVIPEIPRDLRRALESTEEFLNELLNRNEKMFLANMQIMIRGKSIDEVDQTADEINSRVIKLGCTLERYAVGHEDAFNSTVPLGRNDTFVHRTFTTSSLAVFIPFNVVEIIHQTGLSYGKNALSNNVVLMDRKRNTNPHGFFFGSSGSGKSMGAKMEIFECFYRTDDDIIVIDPDGEFTPIVELLGGQVIELSNASTTFFNMFDINEHYGGEEDPNPVPFKSDFIISLIDSTLNYHDGLDPATRSIIDKCVRKIYAPYMKHIKKPRQKDIPTLSDFFRELKQIPGQEAQDLASALEIYVEGSLNLFSHPTNVETNNRLVCFNSKKLGKQLKTMGMTIVQDYCWNRISKNQAENKYTWLWNDEIHHSLRNPCTGDWLVNSWKRGRKYGLIATGVTQEVRDVCMNEESKALLSNSEFVMLYRQAENMIGDLAQAMNLSDGQISKLMSCEEGTGLFKAGNSIVEFNNRIDRDVAPILFNVLKSNLDKKEGGEEIAG